jgi:hypothetical protein
MILYDKDVTSSDVPDWPGRAAAADEAARALLDISAAGRATCKSFLIDTKLGKRRKVCGWWI